MNTSMNNRRLAVYVAQKEAARVRAQEDANLRQRTLVKAVENAVKAMDAADRR
jgi:hypothetical protein